MPWPDTAPPLVAILRGVRPEEIEAIAGAVFEAGFRAIEIPLNSPDPIASIERLCQAFGERALCGAGTVLSVADVQAVHAVGGRLVVTPNTDTEVIAAAVALGMTVMPGFATPTEGLAAIRAGARSLKLFPAGTYGPAHLKAVRDILPKGTPVYAVGGVGGDNMRPWIEAGAAGFGIGGGIYTPGATPGQTAEKAQAMVKAWQAATTRPTGARPSGET